MRNRAMVRQDVFVDSDNLGSLDHLFEYVGHVTSTLVVLASQAIYCRPWRVGEMVTSKLHAVPVHISVADAVPLEDSFTDGYDETV